MIRCTLASSSAGKLGRSHTSFSTSAPQGEPGGSNKLRSWQRRWSSWQIFPVPAGLLGVHKLRGLKTRIGGDVVHIV